MGSQNSKELIFRDNSLLSLEENSIDYNGINTFEDGLEEIQNNFDENFDENSNTTFEKNSVDINLKAESNKIPITFEYEYEGNTVYLSGNFCNWNQYFLMQNNQNGKHTLTLYLNKGLIQYKFKVNNEWKYNEKYPTINDNGNKNNFIDTTNWEIFAERSDETTNSNTESSFRQSANKSFISNIEFQNSQKKYCNYIPKKMEMNDSAIKIPEQYINKIIFDKNIRQIELENNNHFSKNGNNITGNNDSYKSINPVMPEQINHINYKMKGNENSKAEEKEPIICSIVSRHRLKFTTFVYYKNE